MSFRAARPAVTNPLAIRGASAGRRRAATEHRAGRAGRPPAFCAFLLAIFAACCMLWAQQAATAHYIEHLGSAMAASSAATDHDGDDPLQACATCAVFAGLAGAPPAFVSALALVPAAAVQAADSPSAYLPARSTPPYAARAPPAIL
jgi:hypothetical protein